MSLNNRQIASLQTPAPNVPRNWQHTPVTGKPAAPDTAFAFTADAVTDLLTTVAHGLAVNERIRVSSATALPAGLAAATDYYVIASGLTADAFKVSAALGGAAIDITSAGTGPHTWQRRLTTVEQAAANIVLAFYLNGFGELPRRASFLFTVDPVTDLLTAVSYDAAPGIATPLAHGFAAGERVRFSTSGTLPAGLALATDYYVIASGLTTDSFKVSATAGGSAVDITGSGTGNHQCYLPGAVALLDAFDAYYARPDYLNWWHDDQMSREQQWLLRRVDINEAAAATLAASATSTGVGSGAATAPVPAIDSSADTCAVPDANLDSGTPGSTPINISLTCATGGATIYYRLNSGSYLPYTAPVTLAVSDQLWYYASKAGLSDSVTGLYENS